MNNEKGKLQTVFSRFAKNDYTKYPFLKEAAKYLKLPDLRIEDLVSIELQEILNRAEERLEEAILYTRVTRNPHHDEDVEILSFTVAIVLAIATQNSFIQKRYALAEAIAHAFCTFNLVHARLSSLPRLVLIESVPELALVWVFSDGRSKDSLWFCKLGQLVLSIHHVSLA